MFANGLPWAKSGKRASTEVRLELLKILQNDQVQALSSLELNQWASMTYHEGQHSGEDDICETIFSTINEMIAAPNNRSVVTLQKSLTVARHILVCGADRVLPESRVLIAAVQALQSYNTALAAQQQMWYKIMGGAVDQGGPVRDAAEKLAVLWASPDVLAKERAQNADPTSLVPVGSRQEVGFMSEEARRYQVLQDQMRKQQVVLNSNLAKAKDGFGGGYSSKDGKSVVGAAHSLEEMMKKAQEEKLAFSDESASKGSGLMPAAPAQGFSEYTAPNLNTQIVPTPPVAPATADLLDFTCTSTAVATPASSAANDLLSLAVSPTVAPVHQVMSVPPVQDPFAPVPSHQKTSNLLTQLVTPVPSVKVMGVGTPQQPFSSTSGASAGVPISHPSHSVGADPFAGLGGPSQVGINLSGAPPPTARGGMQVSSVPPALGAGTGRDTDTGDDPWVMGGTVGSGLQPVGPPPSVPPPPLPPAFAQPPSM